MKTALIAVLAVCGVAYGAGDDFFQEQRLDLPGIVLAMQAADFNGDNRPDLAFLISEASGKRVLLIYLQRDTDRFPPAVSQRIELSTTVNLFQAADLDGDRRFEIYTVDREQLLSYRHDGLKFIAGQSLPLGEPLLVASGVEGCLLWERFIFETGGQPIAFLPVVDGLLLWEYRAGTFVPREKISLAALVSEGERSVKFFGREAAVMTLRLPEIVFGQRGERPELYLVWPDRVAIYSADDGGRFSTAEPLLFRCQRPASGNFCQAKLVDFDRDRRLDLICSESSGGTSSARTDICFFGSDRFRQTDPSPTHTVTLTDACGNLLVDDFDRAGGLELAVPAMELGTISSVKMMVTKRTDFHILIYSIDQLGRPAKDPQVRWKATCHLDFDKANPAGSIRVDWSGDYNGDGRPDLLLCDGGGHLALFPGIPNQFLDTRPELVLDIAAPESVFPLALNGDSRSDLVVIHYPTADGTRVTLLTTNRIM